MSAQKVRGLAAANALFDGVPAAARHALLDLLGRGGRDILAQQRALVARLTGALGGGLESLLDADRLRVLVGLVGRRKRFGASAGRASQDLFYGRVVDGGRVAQTVIVTRRLKRRIEGNGRTSKRRVIYAGKPYRMRVSALAARPFVAPPGAQAALERRAADFWAATFAQTGAGS